MPVPEKLRHILAELRGHAPFTIFGAVMGIVFMFAFNAIGKPSPHTLFAIFHPAHVLLSAMVTASLFRIHENKKNILMVFVIGYVGSIGIATLSDSVVPYIGENILGLEVPTHADVHSGHNHQAGHDDHAGHSHAASESCSAEHSEKKYDLHLGFIEEWYIVNPAAILGILIAFFMPRSKCPHAAHVLLSTWASSAHILMNSTGDVTLMMIGGIFVVLFIAVWLPCCVSDIIFPLLFVNSDLKLVSSCSCSHHKIHSHKHTHKHSDKCSGKEA